MRYSGVSIAYQVGGMLGGAVTPIVATALYGSFAASSPIAAYVGGLALVSFVAVLAIRTRGAGSATAEDANNGEERRIRT